MVALSSDSQQITYSTSFADLVRCEWSWYWHRHKAEFIRIVVVITILIGLVSIMPDIGPTFAIVILAILPLHPLAWLAGRYFYYGRNKKNFLDVTLAIDKDGLLFSNERDLAQTHCRWSEMDDVALLSNYIAIIGSQRVNYKSFYVPRATFQNSEAAQQFGNAAQSFSEMAKHNTLPMA